MPIIKTKTIRTMREIWDEERKLKKEKHEKERQQKQLICCPVAVSHQRTATRKRAEQLVKIRKYYFEHLELKKVALDFFPKYEEYLGEAGF
ncbi:hypothetical protein KJ636_03080, partial [Patescibacteria group bacterium]|nr:hypothetical protein [Patescibacteria group bacterium]